jgi:hypothetical protein
VTLREYTNTLKATNAQHLRSLATNRDHIELLKTYVTALKETVSSLTTRVRELVESEACLREQLGAGVAVAMGRGTGGNMCVSSRRRRRASKTRSHHCRRMQSRHYAMIVPLLQDCTCTLW